MDTSVYFKMVKRAARIISSETDQSMAARRFVSGLLEAYTGGSQTPVPPFRHPLSEEMALYARQYSIEMAAYLIGSTYSMLLSDEERQKNGVFYTPPSLGNRLLDLVECKGLDWSQSRVLDPASGCGMFLLLAARRILKATAEFSPGERRKRVMANLKGWERDFFSAWMSTVFLGLLLQEETGEGRGLTMEIVDVRNSLMLRAQELEQYDLVVGNPPYGKIKLDPESRGIWRRGLYGHANLYGLFTDLAVRLTASGGIIAYVTPASFLGGQYFRSLRGLLLKEAPPVTFDFVTKREGVFAGVLQETMLSLFQKGQKPHKVSVSYLTVNSPEELEVTSNGSYFLAKAGRPWVVPRNKDQSVLMRQCGEMSHRLVDYGYQVSTGPLVWNRHKDRLSARESKGAVPVIWAECIPPTGCGIFCFKAKGRNHSPWYKPKSSLDPNLIHQSCVLVQRTTSLEQNRRLLAAVLPESFLKEHGGCVAVENHVNMIRSMPGRMPLVSMDVLAALINSKVLDDVFRCISGSTAVSAYELESLPLPEPKALERLEAALGNADQFEIDRIVKDIYTHDKSRAAA